VNAELRGLIARAKNLDLKFKSEDQRLLPDEEIVKAVMCLANPPGGESAWFLIGVEDDGNIAGTRPRHGESTDRLRLHR
jgi:ATP-dependent DNA helicase RecG